MNVILKNGTRVQARVLLSDIGYGRRWDDVDYKDVIEATAKKLNIDVNEIERAYL